MLKEIKIPLKIIYENDKFLLVDLTPLFEYVNGRKTENQIGFRGTFVDLATYDKFPAKILNLNPQITPAMLESCRDKLFVRLVNAYAKPYVKDGRIAYSISASDLEMMKKSAPSAAERM